MSTAPWLSQLAPDRAPPPLGWWPPAPGWWGVGLLLLIGIAAGVWRWRQWRRPFARWQRAALQELAHLEAAATETSDHAAADGALGNRTRSGKSPSAGTRVGDAAFARGVQHLLRRHAVVRYGRETVAALSGEAWIAFVVAHGGHDWAGDSGRHLLRCAYGGGVAESAAQDHLDAAAHRQRWLRGAQAFVRAAG